MTDTTQPQTKQSWSPPAIAEYGDVEKLTLGPGDKPKHLGASDDFGVAGVS
jgi:hypothetical protein